MCDDKGRCNKVYKNPNYGCQDSIGNRNVGGNSINRPPNIRLFNWKFIFLFLKQNI